MVGVEVGSGEGEGINVGTEDGLAATVSISVAAGVPVDTGIRVVGTGNISGMN